MRRAGRPGAGPADVSGESARAKSAAHFDLRGLCREHAGLQRMTSLASTGRLDRSGATPHVKPMTKSSPVPAPEGSPAAQAGPTEPRALTPAVRRALAEAEARRAEIDRRAEDHPKEINGRRGPEPVRYGDWEVKGIASDF
jgi:hypothetical protein